MNYKLTEMISEWNDPLGARTMSNAEELIKELQVELGGKIAVIKVLKDDIEYYKLKASEREL